MSLTRSQRTLLEKALASGGELGVGLSDRDCAYLVATIARDPNILSEFREIDDRLSG